MLRLIELMVQMKFEATSGSGWHIIWIKFIRRGKGNPNNSGNDKKYLMLCEEQKNNMKSLGIRIVKYADSIVIFASSQRKVERY